MWLVKLTTFAIEAIPHLDSTNTLSLHSRSSGSGAVDDHKIIPSHEKYDPASYEYFIVPVGSTDQVRFKCIYFGCKVGMFDKMQRARVHVAQHYFLKPYTCTWCAYFFNANA
jgi:hypothetical protein